MCINQEMDEKTSLVVIGRPEDFIDADLEVAVANLDVVENASERALEKMSFIMNRPMDPNMTRKEMMEEAILTKQAQDVWFRCLEARAIIAGLKTKVVRKRAIW